MRFSEAGGHKVVSTTDAETVAKVAGFVVDATTARVTAVRVKKTEGDADLLPWADIVGFGPDAVTVASRSALVRGAKEAGGDVLGSLLLTEGGVEVGEVKDVDFDPATGSITTLITKGGEVAGDRMMALGSYALVVCNPG